MKMFIFLLLTSISVSAQVNLGNIEFSGKVQENGRGISGVAVTDGYNVVVTDIEGKYKLTGNGMADFIYITIPSGYEIPYENNLPRFYEPVTNKTNKRLFDYDWIGTQATDHLFMTGAVSPGAIVEIEVIDRFGNVYVAQHIIAN